MATLRYLFARLSYEMARCRENRLSARIPNWIPSVQLSPGRPGRRPLYAYSEAEIEATFGQYRRHPFGSWQRDALEAGYHRTMTEFRTQKDIYSRALEACGYEAADRALVKAGDELERSWQ